MWNRLEILGEKPRDKITWNINQQVIQTGTSRGLKVEYALEGIPQKDVSTEKDVVEMIFSGTSNKQIMEELDIKKMSIRWQELRELQETGYEILFNEDRNSYILTFSQKGK